MKRFILLNGPAGSASPIPSATPGLPRSLGGRGGVVLENQGGNERGIACRFRVIEPGVYVISTLWRTRLQGETEKNQAVIEEFRSNPVLLLVRPGLESDKTLQGLSSSDDSGHLCGIKLQEYLEDYYGRHKNDNDFKCTVLPTKGSPSLDQ
jgi:hypothetical protein